MHGGEAIDEAGHSSFARQIPSGLAPLNPSIQSLQLPMTSKHDDNLSQSESPVSILATQQLASAQRHGAYPSSLPPHADKSQARAAVDDEILSMRARHWATVLCQTDARMNVPAHRSTAVKSKESVEVSSTLAQTTTSSIVTHETRAAALSGRASSLLENFIRDNGVDRLETPDSFFGADSSTTTRQLSADSSVADKPAPAQKPKRFQCQLCGSTFAQRGDMIRHIRVKGALLLNTSCGFPGAATTSLLRGSGTLPPPFFVFFLSNTFLTFRFPG